MEEQYAVYLYTAGTKPPQPAVHYCPHSVSALGAAGDEAEVVDDEFGCEPAWPPSAPGEGEGLQSRGVRWGIDAGGRIVAHQPVHGPASSTAATHAKTAAPRDTRFVEKELLATPSKYDTELYTLLPRSA